MTFVQKFFTAVLPRRMADAMQAESRAWRIRCRTCGTEKTWWDAGGIRYGARSTGKFILSRCAKCGRLRRSEVYRPTPAGR